MTLFKKWKLSKLKSKLVSAFLDAPTDLMVYRNYTQTKTYWQVYRSYFESLEAMLRFPDTIDMGIVVHCEEFITELKQLTGNYFSKIIRLSSTAWQTAAKNP